jgi:hypothetical protein
MLYNLLALALCGGPVDAPKGAIVAAGGCVPDSKRMAYVRVSWMPLHIRDSTSNVSSPPSPSRNWRAQPLTAAYTRQVADIAHAHGVPLHIDGARFWNAVVAQGLRPTDLADPADTVTFCLSKGLACPVGSLVVGRRDVIWRARRARKMVGGGMRQAGILAAAGLVALSDGPDGMIRRLSEDLRRLGLFVWIHRFDRMAVAARARVSFLHGLPYPLCQHHPLRFELLLGVDASQNMMVQVGGGFYFRHHLVDPFLWNVAVRASRTNAGPVLEVNGVLQFGIGSIAHFVAGDAERFLICQFERPIEAAP